MVQRQARSLKCVHVMWVGAPARSLASGFVCVMTSIEIVDGWTATNFQQERQWLQHR